MLTVKLDKEHITLNERDACRLAEGIMLALRDPKGTGKDGFRFGRLALSVEGLPVTPTNKAFSAGKPILTDC